MDNNLYRELAIDIVANIDKMDMFMAEKIVRFLKEEGFIDINQLKEYYVDC